MRGYFDTINHEWLRKFIEHRIKDRRVIRHVEKWLKAGVLEEGERTQMEEGTPRRSGSKPNCANSRPSYDEGCMRRCQQQANGCVA